MRSRIAACGVVAVLAGCHGSGADPIDPSAVADGGVTDAGVDEGAVFQCPATPVCSLPVASGAAAPVIFNASATARPGDVVSLQGARFSASASAWLQEIGPQAESPQLLETLAASPGHVAVMIPATQNPGVWAVWVEDGGQSSAPVIVNQPRIDQVEFDEVGSGNVFRVFGRNLHGVNVQLRAAGAPPLDVALKTSDDYIATLVAPALQAGTVYTLVATAPSTCGCVETEAVKTVAGRAAGADPFALDVPWGADFTFASNVYDVTTDSRLITHANGIDTGDDTAALQAAIDKAHEDGGGVVYLPAGSYRVGSAGLGMRARVVLKGAGASATKVQYGFSAPADGAWALGFIDGGGTLAGVDALTLQNVDTTGAWGRNIVTYPPQMWSKIFFKDAVLDLGGGGPIWTQEVHDLLFANTQVLSVLAAHNSGANGGDGVLLLSGSFVSMRGSTVTWNVGGIGALLQDSVIETSTFVRDGAKHTIDNTRGLQLNFAQRVVVLGNQLKVTGTDNYQLNDGETILTEGGGPDREDADHGTLTTAAATSLTDSTKTWGVIGHPAVVVLISGAGAGEWRNLVDRTATTLTIDAPWDIVPAAGDKYTITNWGAEHWLIKDNQLTGNAKGIELYWASAHSVAIVNNTLTNSHGIAIEPTQTTVASSGTNNFTPLLDVLVADNDVTDTAGLTPAHVALALAADAQQMPGEPIGIVGYGVEIRRNQIVGTSPSTQNFYGGHVYPEGYCAYAIFAKSSVSAASLPAFLGTIFQGNRAQNSNIAVKVGTGDTDTIDWDTTVMGVQLDFSDEKINDAVIASIGTVRGP